jgi:hypothetical protein
VQQDDWADAAIVSMQVRTDGRAFTDDGPVTLGPIVGRQDIPVWRVGATDESSALFAKSRSKVRVEHIRDSAGHVLSIATVAGESGEPPKRMYLFKDGKIQMVASPTYQRRGTALIRKALRLTMLDSQGGPLVQSDTRTVDEAGTRGLALAFRTAASSDDVGPNHTDDGGDEESGPCDRERIAFIAKTSAAAALSTAYITAMSLCLGGDIEACARVVQLGPALITASQTAYEAWEKWQACRSSGGFPTRTASAEPENPGGGKMDGLSNLVDAFIEAAEKAGNFHCSSDGDRCIYFST